MSLNNDDIIAKQILKVCIVRSCGQARAMHKSPEMGTTQKTSLSSFEIPKYLQAGGRDCLLGKSIVIKNCVINTDNVTNHLVRWHLIGKDVILPPDYPVLRISALLWLENTE